MKRKVLIPINQMAEEARQKLTSSETIQARRGLGDGRWDRILKERMVELSEADNYEEAKDEWIATGEVYSSNFSRFAPEWVTNTRNGVGKCLCGHNVIYHFKIENTIIGDIECVGSDHINTYLIMREISSSLGIDMDSITDEQIQEWINVRVKSMKSEAWWRENGESFTMMFNAVKEMDLHYNVHTTGNYFWDHTLEQHIETTKIRKRASGSFGSANYEMASIVWRWNHPDNEKNQQNVHGYPNQRLMQDLALFYVKSTQFRPEFERIVKERMERRKQISDRKAREEEERRLVRERRLKKEAERQAYLNSPEYKAEQERLERLRQETIRKREEERLRNLQVAKNEQKSFFADITRNFRFGCGFYNIPLFDETWANDRNMLRHLVGIKEKMDKNENLSDGQEERLYRAYFEWKDKKGDE